MLSLLGYLLIFTGFNLMFTPLISSIDKLDFNDKCKRLLYVEVVIVLISLGIYILNSVKSVG